jgi:uncharacterized phage protein (TIGR02220 family)
MKYTIEGFSQEYAMTLKKHIERKGKLVEIKIDCTDLVILRWFVDFYPKMKKMVIDGKEFAWLTHKKLLEDLPLIDISKGAFIERMQKLVEFNILDYQFIKEGGTFSLYTFGDNYNKLIDNKGMVSNNDGVQGQTDTGVGVQTSTRVYGQTDTKDNTINNTSINNYSNNNIYTSILDYLNEKIGTKYRVSSRDTQSHINARLNDGYVLDDFIKVIDNKVAQWKNDKVMCQYLRPSTLFGTKFESYLNEKSVIKKSEKYTKEQLDTFYTDIDSVVI